MRFNDNQRKSINIVEHQRESMKMEGGRREKSSRINEHQRESIKIIEQTQTIPKSTQRHQKSRFGGFGDSWGTSAAQSTKRDAKLGLLDPHPSGLPQAIIFITF